MLEIKIDHLINNPITPYLSGSVAELGDYAGNITWNNCKREAQLKPLLTTAEQIAEAKQYFKEFGAWEDLDTWPDSEINALTLQWIASVIREFESFDTFEEYEAAEMEGTVSGGIFKHSETNEFYFQLTH